MINENDLLAKIVVFDSGLGSLSIIKEIQKIVKTDIVYFADQKNYPYGTKSQAQLAIIIKKTINLLEKKFKPDIIVVASNTPSLMLNLSTKKIIDVKPPLKLAQKKSESKKIGILATKSAIESKGLENYIKENNIPKSYKIFKINGSNLVDLVESGKFLNKKSYCKKIIKESLEDIIISEKIDVITLSSTHLLFLKALPNITALSTRDIVNTIELTVSKLTTLVDFMSGFAIAAGLFILSGSIASTKYRRLRESAVLKILGAKRKMVASILGFEYATLGIIAALVGIIVAQGFSWAIMKYMIKSAWHWQPEILAWAFCFGVLLTVTTGILSSLDVINDKPLKTIRETAS